MMAPRPDLLPEHWQAWLAHPVTREYQRILEGLVQNRRAALGRGDSLDPDRAERTLALTARSVGYVEGVEAALGIGLDLAIKETDG